MKAKALEEVEAIRRSGRLRRDRRVERVKARSRAEMAVREGSACALVVR
jgi:hypothetical protein